jgi:glycosyltransferase involved in cell wall biosynthesis
MKILLVGNYFYPEHIGGIEIVTSNLVRYYREDGHQVCWMAADVPPRYRNQTIDDVPIRAWNITEERLGFPQPLPMPDSILKLYRTVRWCEVVHLHDCLYIINILIFLIARLLKKPIVITQHTEVIPYKDKWKNWLQSFALRTIGVVMHKYSNRSAFISPNTRDHLPFITKHVKHPPVVIPNGVDTEFFQPYPSAMQRQLRQSICEDVNKPLLLFVGRFVTIKGVHLLIPLISKHPEWHWLLVGRPDEYDPSGWNYSNVTFWPSLGLDGLRTAYAVADMSIHPSAVVGISLTIPESMACGTPVLLSETILYGLPKEDIENFILIDLDTERIETVISGLLADRKKLASYALKARNYAVSRSDWRAIARQYVSLLEKACQEN